jgi:hypothetical protein
MKKTLVWTMALYERLVDWIFLGLEDRELNDEIKAAYSRFRSEMADLRKQLQGD